MVDSRRARALGGVGLGVGLAALAGAVGVHLAGSRLRRAVDTELDPLYEITDNVVHHHVMTADGATIHVVERSDHGADLDARPVLLLHGWTLQWWIWAAQFNTLPARYRVFAWDMRGHGRSGVGSDGVTLDAMADDVASVLETLELTDTIVIGHSMGGMTLGAFCARHREALEHRVGALGFMATSAATGSLSGAAGGAVGLLRLLASPLADSVRAPQLSWPDSDLSALALRAVFGRHPSGRAIDVVRRMVAEMDVDVAQDALRSAVHHDVREDLRSVDKPTLVIVGSHDRLTPPGHARTIADSIDGSRLVVLDGVGHQVMQEAPRQVAELIDDLDAAAAIDLTDAGLLR